MIGRNVNDDALAVVCYRLASAPARPFHIDQDAAAVVSPCCHRKHGLQLQIVRIRRLNAGKVVGNAVSTDFPQYRTGIMLGRIIHGDIKKSTVFEHITRSILLLGIQTIKYFMRMNETITLSV